MKILRAFVVAVIFACLAGYTSSARTVDDEENAVNEDQIGERCEKGQIPSRSGIECAAAFIEIDGELREEWEHESSYVLNGRKGDAILSTGCGFIANLLRKVNPEQQYSHAGMMVADRHRIRHSTASVEWVMDRLQGSPPGTEGIQEVPLKYAWPGSITQWADEAFDGAFLEAPSGELYELQSFNASPAQCDELGQLTPDTVLKPPPVVEATDPLVRAKLEDAANLAEGILAHYRFYGYSQPAEVLFTTEAVPGDWADGTVGSVCSAFVWRALKDSGFTLEGAVIEEDDVTFRGAQVDPQTEDGLYVYTVGERAAAAQFIYNEIAEQVAKKVTAFEDVFIDATDDMGNQMVNCFGFDWCGETFSMPALLNGCDPDDDRAQDSPCWLNEGPGVGRAVSPENMLNWDAAPAGPYGYREDVHYALGEYSRVYRWRAKLGTGTLQGVVTDNGNAVANIPVILEDFDIVDFTDASGAYVMEAVPGGLAAVRACAGDRGAQQIPFIVPNGTTTADLAFADGCPSGVDLGEMKRDVRIHGTVKVVDTEDFGSDEIETIPIDITLTVEPNSTLNPNGAEAVSEPISECVGGEVKARIWFEIKLTSELGIELKTHARLYEGQSCQDDDLDGSKDKNSSILKDATLGVNFLLTSEEFGGSDSMNVMLTVENNVAPPQ
jgi:hypothetical protein